MNFSKILSTAFVLAVLAGPSHAALINGGFESGLTGWTTSGLTCSGVGAGYSVATGCIGMDSDPGPHTGSAALYLGTGGGNGVVSQSVATSATNTYHISFWMASGQFNGVSAPNDLLVEFDGSTLLHVTDLPAQAYQFYSYDVVAGGASALLSFTNLHAPSFFLIDDVNVTAVPEPTSLLLMGLGAFTLAVTRRRKSLG